MNSYLFVVFYSLFTNKIDTVYVNNDFLILNNEKSCFTCIKPFSKYFEENADDFIFLNIIKDYNSSDNLPLILKMSTHSIFSKEKASVFYFNGKSIVDSIDFDLNTKTLPLIISYDKDGIKSYEFESICPDRNCSNKSIKRRMRKFYKKRRFANG